MVEVELVGGPLDGTRQQVLQGCYRVFWNVSCDGGVTCKVHAWCWGGYYTKDGRPRFAHVGSAATKTELVRAIMGRQP